MTDLPRLTPLLLLMILGLGAATTTAPTTEPALREFSSRQYRVRWKYPADWIVANPPMQGKVFSAHVPGGDNGFVNLRIARGSQGSSDAAILVDVADGLASFVFKNGGEHVKIKPEQIGDLPARRITFEKQGESQRVKAAYVVAVKDGVEYVFNFAAPAVVFDSLEPAVNEMLKSFEVLD
jgi:hypothetical protein